MTPVRLPSESPPPYSPPGYYRQAPMRPTRLQEDCYESMTAKQVTVAATAACILCLVIPMGTLAAWQHYVGPCGDDC